MSKTDKKNSLITGLILGVVAILILYIYNPYRLKSTVEYDFNRYFSMHEKASGKMNDLIAKLQPLYEEQYEMAMGILTAETEEEATEVAVHVQELAEELEFKFINSSEYKEVMEIDEDALKLKDKINLNLNELKELDKEKAKDALKIVAQEQGVKVGDLEFLMAN